MGKHFKSLDRNTLFLLPPSIQDWLPEKHLARFIVEIVERLDLAELRATYRHHGGEAGYHPESLLAMMLYGYATGVFSSRKLERATYDSVAMRYLAANLHPDHDSIAAFRRRCLPFLAALFTQVLVIAQELGCLAFGRIALDGTKIKANASKHRALSWKRSQEIQAQLRAEVDKLLKAAEDADRRDEFDGIDLPVEIARREDRLAKIDEVQKRIREREAQRQEKDEADVVPVDTAQINLTDEESRIMPMRGGFEQCYNAQAAVDTASMLVVAASITQAPNDVRALAPLVLEAWRKSGMNGSITSVSADTGYFSKDNVATCALLDMTPHIALKREHHHSGLDRFRKPVLPHDNSIREEMRYRLETPEGREIYAERKHTIEPTFGVMKAVMGFRQFSLRGYEKVKAEWRLVCLSYNLKKLAKATA